MDMVKERKNDMKKGVIKDDLLGLMIKASMEETEESPKLTEFFFG